MSAPHPCIVCGVPLLVPNPTCSKCHREYRLVMAKVKNP